MNGKIYCSNISLVLSFSLGMSHIFLSVLKGPSPNVRSNLVKKIRLEIWPDSVVVIELFERMNVIIWLSFNPNSIEIRLNFKRFKKFDPKKIKFGPNRSNENQIRSKFDPMKIKFGPNSIQIKSNSIEKRPIKANQLLSLIHIWRCRRYSLCRSRWSPYH